MAHGLRLRHSSKSLAIPWCRRIRSVCQKQARYQAPHLSFTKRSGGDQGKHIWKVRGGSGYNFLESQAQNTNSNLVVQKESYRLLKRGRNIFKNPSGILIGYVKKKRERRRNGISEENQLDINQRAFELSLAGNLFYK